MTTRVLSLINLNDCPFSDKVADRMEASFKPLIDEKLLEIDRSGKTKDALYQLTFLKNRVWEKSSKTGCWFHPRTEGVSGAVDVAAVQKRNYCHNVRDCKTCEPIFRHSPDELGKAIADDAIHEAAHLFGIGADDEDGGHSGNPRDPMFYPTRHPDFAPITTDSKRSKKYTIVSDDTLSKIADRIGFVDPIGDYHTLYDFVGADGKANRDLLRSKNPDQISPGEVIWIPDIQKRLEFIRSLELQDRAFSKTQFDTMRSWVGKGRTLVTVGK